LRGKKLHEVLKRKDTFYLLFYPSKETLLFSVNPTFFRMHLCTDTLPREKEEHPFLLLLRKHIVNANLHEIEQLNFDRVAKLVFHTRLTPSTKRVNYLYIELIHRYSNAILTDERNTIIGAFKSIEGSSSSSRLIIPGIKYTPPPINNRLNPLKITKEEFISAISKNQRWREIFTGMSNDIVEQLNHTNPTQEELWSTFKRWIEEIKKPPQQPLSPLIEKNYQEEERKALFQSEISRARKSIKQGRKRLNKKLTNIEKELKEASKFEHYKQMADSLLAYKTQVKAGENTIPNIYNPKESFKITIDRENSINKEVEKLFKYYKKLKRKLNLLPEVRAKLLEKLSLMEDLERKLQDMSLEELKQISNRVEREVEDTKGRLPYHKFEMHGWSILVGKNSKTNDMLTFKIADRDDLWFHAKGIGGAHVILRSNNRAIPPDRLIRIAAEIAAFYSKAQEGTKIIVDYTKRKYVKKPPHSPEGYVIYEKYKSILVRKAQKIQDILQSP
ncbi:MAG: NFACT family protein, partial [Synergistetes bacterium]|nr:NFACT family protein [Synergistota bacterium]